MMIKQYVQAMTSLPPCWYSLGTSLSVALHSFILVQYTSCSPCRSCHLLLKILLVDRPPKGLPCILGCRSYPDDDIYSAMLTSLRWHLHTFLTGSWHLHWWVYIFNEIPFYLVDRTLLVIRGCSCRLIDCVCKRVCNLVKRTHAGYRPQGVAKISLRNELIPTTSR